MLYTIPRLDDRLAITPVPRQGDETPQYVVSSPGVDARITLTATAVYLLMLADGRATVQIMQRRAAKIGMAPPEGFVEQLVGALVEAGLAEAVDAASLPHDILAGTFHRCEGCGRSCEGHLIGPLPRGEVRTVLGHMEALGELVPRLADVKPIVKLPDVDGLFLKVVDGRCVFLADDNRCDLHRHFGADSKPSICRTFPLMRVYTERGLRLGVNNGCFRNHALEPQPEPEKELLASVPAITAYHAPYDLLPLVVPDPGHRDRLRRFTDTEERVLDYAARADATVAGLCRLLLGRPPQTSASSGGNGRTPVDTLTPALMGRVLDVVRGFVERAALANTFIGFVAGTEAVLGESYRDLTEVLEELLEEGAPDEPIPTYERARRHLLDEVRRLLWLRGVLHFETPHHAIAASLVGWVVALLAFDEATDEGFDALGERMTAWHRLVTEDDLHERLFASQDEALGLLRAMADAGR